MDLGQASYIFDPESGRALSAEHCRVAEIINDYDPNLQLVWIPPENRALCDDQPFGIVHMQGDGRTYMVRRCKEEDVNENLVAWLWMNDAERNGQDLLGRVRKIKEAQDAMKLKRKIEEQEEKREIALSILKSPKHTYRHNGVVYN